MTDRKDWEAQLPELKRRRRPEDMDHDELHPQIVEDERRKIMARSAEIIGVEPTIQQIVKACHDTLGDEICNEIGVQEDTATALGLVFTALIEKGIADPEVFLRKKGILE